MWNFVVTLFENSIEKIDEKIEYQNTTQERRKMC